MLEYVTEGGIAWSSLLRNRRTGHELRAWDHFVRGCFVRDYFLVDERTNLEVVNLETGQLSATEVKGMTALACWRDTAYVFRNDGTVWKWTKTALLRAGRAPGVVLEAGIVGAYVWIYSSRNELRRGDMYLYEPESRRWTKVGPGWPRLVLLQAVPN